MNKNNRYDSLFQYYAPLHGLCWKDIKAQAIAESSLDPAAESKPGAKGIMQFMPATWKEFDDKDEIPALDDPHNVEENIAAGCKYMEYLYGRLSEIPNHEERLKFARAAYNGGIGNVNKALAIARKSLELPFGFSEWKAQGAKPGVWQEWEYTKEFLELIPEYYPRTKLNHNEMINYVDKIEAFREAL